jgi:hypothetical protein
MHASVVIVRARFRNARTARARCDDVRIATMSIRFSRKRIGREVIDVFTTRS